MISLSLSLSPLARIMIPLSQGCSRRRRDNGKKAGTGSLQTHVTYHVVACGIELYFPCRTPQKIIQNAKRVLKDQTLELTFRTRELKKLTQGRGKDKKAKGAAGGRQKKKANAADSKVAVSAAKRFRPTGSMHAVNPIGNEFEQTYSAIEIANSQQGFGSPTTVITSSNLEATAVIKPTPATPSDSNFADYFISQMLSAPCR